MSALAHLIAGSTADEECAFRPADLGRALMARIGAQSASAPSGLVRDWLVGLARVNGWM